jgi:hypothetical protein
MLRPTAAAIQAPAARTAEIKHRQTRRQCARQRLHARISDSVPCRPRAPHPSDTDPPHHTCALAPIRADPPPPGRNLGILLHTRPAAQRMLRPTAAAIQAPAARTAEIERRQTRRQCARQRLHARISDSVVCRPRAPQPSDTDPPHHTCALAPIRADPPPPGRNLGTPLHTRPAAQRMLRPTAAAIQAPATHTAEMERRQTWRQCARQRLHARISDSVHCRPRAPHPSDTDPPHHTCALARSEPIRRHPVATSAYRTTRDPQPSACPDQQRQQYKPQPHVPPR